MRKVFLRIWDLYYDGFRNMTLGKVLWTIILAKLFIMFCILRIFFFPNYLKDLPDETAKGEYVSNELIHRAIMAAPEDSVLTDEN